MPRSGTVAPSPPTVETHRLVLRAPECSDVDPLFEIQGDPVPMRHTYCAPDREATAAHLRRYAGRFAEDGFAPWTAILKREDRVVGWGGLNKDPSAPEWGTEVAYFFHPGHWGIGLATELVEASLELAFGPLELEEVGAFSRPENRGSRRVLEKAGFEIVRYVPELEREHFVRRRGAS